MALLTGGFGAVQSVLTSGLGGRVPHTHGFRSNPAVVDPDVAMGTGLDGEIDTPILAPLHTEQFNARGITITLPVAVDLAALDKYLGWLAMIRPATCNITVVDQTGTTVATLTSPVV